MREKQMQREAVFKEFGGVGTGMMRFLGLKRVGEKGVQKVPRIKEGQVDKGGKASVGGGEAEKDAGGTSKEGLAKGAGGSKEQEKKLVESGTVQSVCYDVSVFSHGEAWAITQ